MVMVKKSFKYKQDKNKNHYNDDSSKWEIVFHIADFWEVVFFCYSSNYDF